MNIDGREYREIEASDLPKVLLGSLSAVLVVKGRVHPAKFLGTGFEVHGTGWQISGSGEQGKDELRYGNYHIYVDITPRKGYVIWGHKLQRFILGGDRHVVVYGSRTDAQVAIENLMLKTGLDPKNCSVVEFNIPEPQDA